MGGGRCFGGREGQVNRGTKARAPPLSPVSPHTHTHTHTHTSRFGKCVSRREGGGREVESAWEWVTWQADTPGADDSLTEGKRSSQGLPSTSWGPHTALSASHILTLFLASPRGMQATGSWAPVGVEPAPLQWKHGVLTTGPLGRAARYGMRLSCSHFTGGKTKAWRG